MKKMKLASAIAFVVALASIGTASADSGGTITFTGSVGDATCTVSGGTGTDGGTGNFTVALPQASLADLAAAGDTAKVTPFIVQIGGPAEATCAAGTVADMSFLPSSPRVDASNGALINALANGAQNTEIQLLDDADAVIDLRTGAVVQSVTIPVGATQANMNYSAQYLAKGAAATSGLVRTDVLYNVVYN